jgi:hypothetical protein
MVGEKPHYLSYLLRLWQTSDGEKKVWRASLESPSAGERHGFASLKDLFDFLEAQTGQIASPKKPGCGPHTRGRRR